MSSRALTRPILTAALMALVPALVLGCPAPQEEAPAVEAPAPEAPEAPAEEPLGKEKDAIVFVAWTGFRDKCAADQPGDKCVVVDPTVYIWKDGKDKYKKFPKKVVWEVAQTDLYWTFDYDKDKGGDGDHLGPVGPIECGKPDTKSKKVSKDLEPGKDLNWTYRIKVYQCTNDVRSDCLCQTDPRVIIKD